MTDEERFLLHDAIGEFLAKMLGEDTEWILTYRPDDGPPQVIATMHPDHIADVFEGQVEALRRGAISGVTKHETSGEPS